MKSIVFFVTACVVISSAWSYVPTEDSEELMHQVSLKILRDELRQRAMTERTRSYLEAICPGYGSHLENVTAEVVICAAGIDEDEETICSTIQNHLKKCAQPVTELLEECLPKQSKKLPAMVIDMMLEMSKYLCRTDGEHILELSNPCIKNVNTKTQRCSRRLLVQIQEYKRQGELPSVEKICGLFTSMRPCLQSHLNQACGHPITREAFLQMYDKTTSICHSYENNEIDVV